MKKIAVFGVGERVSIGVGAVLARLMASLGSSRCWRYVKLVVVRRYSAFCGESEWIPIG